MLTNAAFYQKYSNILILWSTITITVFYLNVIKNVIDDDK